MSRTFYGRAAPAGAAGIRPIGSAASRSGAGELDLPRDALRVVLALLVFFTIGRAHQHFGFLGAMKPALLLFGAGAALAVLNPASVRWDNAWSAWPAKGVAALGVLACLSVPFALSMGTGGSFMVHAYSKVLLTFFLLLVALRSPRDLYLFVWAYVLGCGFLVYLSIFYFSLWTTAGLPRLGSMYFYDANDLGVVLNVAIPLCVVLFQNSNKVGKVASGVILLGIGASLARSGSRGGFLGLLAVGIGILLLIRNVSVPKRVGIVAIVAAGLFWMAPQNYWHQMETLKEPTQDANWTDPYGRKAIAERGVGYMLDHPVLGVGVGNFHRAEGLVSEAARQRAEKGMPYRWTAAHNSFVQIGAELGIPGLLLFCSLVFGSMVGMGRLRKRLPARWRRQAGQRRFLYDLATYLPVSLVGFAVSGFFVSFAYHDVFYVLVLFVTGTYLCAGKLVREERALTSQSATDFTAQGGRPQRGRAWASERS